MAILLAISPQAIEQLLELLEKLKKKLEKKINDLKKKFLKIFIICIR